MKEDDALEEEEEREEGGSEWVEVEDAAAEAWAARPGRRDVRVLFGVVIVLPLVVLVVTLVLLSYVMFGRREGV